MKIDVVYNKSCEKMDEVDSNSVDLTLTSPPYDTFRDYKDYTFNFQPIADEIYRVTKLGGTLVWVVGDATIRGSETGSSFKQALYFKEIGFNLHDTMIYRKNGFSHPSRNRYHQIFEYMFILTKGKIRTFNPIKDRLNEWDSWGRNTARQRDGTLKEGAPRKSYKGLYGMRFNIWKYKVGGSGMSTRDELGYKHPAIFPDKLAEDHILSWTNEGDLVLDPMCGSGTTVKMAKKLKRHFIACEISTEYCEKLIKPALEEIDPLFNWKTPSPAAG